MSFNILLTIIEFVLALGLLAFFHELGHFLVSRLFKIEVQEFGFGFPPRIVKLFRLGGTDFTLNWIPFGAFVLPKGENDPSVPGGLAAAKPLVRIAVLVGGPLMNMIIAAILFAAIFTRTGLPDTSKVMIMEVNAGSPAAVAGVQVNDQILSVNGTPVKSMAQLSTLVKANLGKNVTILLQRNGQQVTLQAVPRTNPPEGQGALGIVMSNPIQANINFFQAIPAGVSQTLNMAGEIFMVPVRMIQGIIPASQARLVSPIGIYDMFAQVRTVDQTQTAQNPQSAGLTTLSFIAMISVALGFTNILPLPALDGGRILFVLPELLFGRRVKPQYENMVHLIGFAALLILMFFLAINDIINPVIIP
jgi:regulator of sigma E protease